MLTESSSAESFWTASKAWLEITQTHPLLHHADKTFGAALYLKFNYKHYEKTGELKAWPSWATLETHGLSKATINESAERYERFHLLEVKRGLYNRAAQRRAGNEYYARFPQGTEIIPCPYQGMDQGTESIPNPRYDQQTVRGDSPLLRGESIRGEPLSAEIPEEAKRGLPKEARPRKLTEKELASLERLAARTNGSGR